MIVRIGDTVKGGIYLGKQLGFHLVVDKYDQAPMPWDNANKSRLPKESELQLMYLERDVLSMQGAVYWTCKEYGETTATLIDFYHGRVTAVHRSITHSVRYVSRYKTLGVNYLNKEPSI